MGMGLDRRQVLAAGAVGAGALLAGCGATATATGPPSSSTAAPRRASRRSERLIGDGSTADTGPQPHQPRVHQLAKGEAPPQFVVVSWDGAGETSSKLFSHWLEVARRHEVPMTFFLTGIYLLPGTQRHRYAPPRHAVGASDLGWLPDRYVHATIRQVRRAWLDGHEIGTHFNGHFCGPAKGVSTWSVDDWLSEIEQAQEFVTTWRSTTGLTDEPPLPFDYDKEVVGGRTPCLEGADNLRKAAAQLGWRYDSSGTRLATWPTKVEGLWDLSLQQVPFPGHDFEVTAMDYNIMFNQSEVTDGDPAMRDTWRAQARDAYLAGFRRSLEGNRSPLVIGNHFEQWNGGIYMDAVEQAIETMAQEPQTRFVTMRQLCDWLDAQDPDVIAGLQGLTGAPEGGWRGWEPGGTAAVR